MQKSLAYTVQSSFGDAKGPEFSVVGSTSGTQLSPIAHVSGTEENAGASVDDGLYQVLPSPEYIRLLKLEAGPPEQEYLSYTLETFLITDPDLPAYRALSYTWGSPVVPEDPEDDEYLEDATYALVQVAQQMSLEESEEPMVFCNGYPMVVTSNLYDGLHQVAQYTDVGYIWCDALCINQSDDKEKSVCIPIMGDIFASATTVIVWLGNDTKYLEDFEWLHVADSMIVETYKALNESRWDCDGILLSGGTDSGEDEIAMSR
jgi:Heterokaryon incompatibility protein (HET)